MHPKIVDEFINWFDNSNASDTAERQLLDATQVMQHAQDAEKALADATEIILREAQKTGATILRQFKTSQAVPVEMRASIDRFNQLLLNSILDSLKIEQTSNL